MNHAAILLAAGLILAAHTQAHAQFRPLASGSSGGGGFGDTKLTYQNGVIRDDDLVPGRGPNQSFNGGDDASALASSQLLSGDDWLDPRNSPQLIGPDGRLLR